MVDMGIMVEGQEGLTWDRFLELAGAVESLGFGSLFRSDHLTALQGFSGRETLALWPSLTALALKTSRIRFGPMVSPMTFRHPAIVARAAADVAILSGGRLDLGLGAGWNRFEHRMFGIHYPAYAARLDLLEEGARLIRALWSGKQVSLQGDRYELLEAYTLPAPNVEIPIIMGGKGGRTLAIAANLADEWNCSYAGLNLFHEKSAQLDRLCEEAGRDPATLIRSIMIPFVIAQNQRGLQDRIDSHREMFPSLPADLAGWQAAGYVCGTPSEIADQIALFMEAGASRFMLQHNDLDDHRSLELFAAEVLPQLADGKRDSL